MTNLAQPAPLPFETSPTSELITLNDIALDDIALDDSERGDVPGWVLVTLMTAGLVVLIWGLAGPALQIVFERAMASVSGIK